MRYHAHYGTAGQGPVYQGPGSRASRFKMRLQKAEPIPVLLSPWPIPRLPNWMEHVHEPLREKELAAVRCCVVRGSPYGDDGWTESISRRLSLHSALRPRGRPRKSEKEVLTRMALPLVAQGLTASSRGPLMGAARSIKHRPTAPHEPRRSPVDEALVSPESRAGFPRGARTPSAARTSVS